MSTTQLGHRLPIAAHTSRPWRIHEITPDFEVEDVWALPTPGGPDDLRRLVSQTVSNRFPDGDTPLPVRLVGRRDGRSGGSSGGTPTTPASARA